MANSSSSSSLPWRPKHYILTGMAIILGASTVIIVTSIILSPAHLHFFITNARSMNGNNDGKDGRSFNFTLVVDNLSRHTYVEYRDVIVNLQLSKRRVKRNSVPARVNGTMPRYQRPYAPISMEGTALVETDFSARYLNDTDDHPTSKIIVTALVRFKVGVAYSRLYDITVSCSPVDFFSDIQDTNVSCSA